jgi:Fe-S-cluster containining protein
MISKGLFKSYELLADKADEAFRDVREKHDDCMECKPHCSDCCHAIFGLFLIEAAFIHDNFSRLPDDARKEVLARCEKADKDLEKLERIMESFKDDPQMQAYTMAKERVRCPLLGDNDECVLYDFRPITCRVYGIPTAIQGKARVCGKANFKKGEQYPIFNLDGVYRDLFNLSKEVMTEAGSDDPDKASLLISVSKALTTPIENFLTQELKKQDTTET